MISKKRLLLSSLSLIALSAHAGQAVMMADERVDPIFAEICGPALAHLKIDGQAWKEKWTLKETYQGYAENIKLHTATHIPHATRCGETDEQASLKVSYMLEAVTPRKYVVDRILFEQAKADTDDWKPLACCRLLRDEVLLNNPERLLPINWPVPRPSPKQILKDSER